MIPESRYMTEEEKKAFWDKMISPEYWEKREKSFKGAMVMFEQETVMWDYCRKNNCSIQDLIDAHKDKNSKAQNY